MSKIKQTVLSLLKDESGQGTAEYVLILVGIVAVGFLFKNELVKIVKNKLSSLGGQISNFTPNN